MDINWEAISVIVLPIVLGVLYFLVKRLIENPKGIYDLFPSIQGVLELAIMFAANQVEYLEKTSQLSNFINPHKDKGEEKLNLAVDIATQKLEKYLMDILGLSVDLPEQFVKDAIQRYVWENPDLFPSMKVAQQSIMQPEQTLDYTTTTEHARLYPLGYPSNAMFSDEVDDVEASNEDNE